MTRRRPVIITDRREWVDRDGHRWTVAVTEAGYVWNRVDA